MVSLAPPPLVRPPRRAPLSVRRLSRTRGAPFFFFVRAPYPSYGSLPSKDPGTRSPPDRLKKSILTHSSFSASALSSPCSEFFFQQVLVFSILISVSMMIPAGPFLE